MSQDNRQGGSHLAVGNHAAEEGNRAAVVGNPQVQVGTPAAEGIPEVGIPAGEGILAGEGIPAAVGIPGAGTHGHRHQQRRASGWT